MLIGIPPLLGPDFLATLRGMGHGDELAIVDGNYPALTMRVGWSAPMVMGCWRWSRRC
jgi:L-fucose mutarotase/ribose pyranase (RbsD/FucU family)